MGTADWSSTSCRSASLSGLSPTEAVHPTLQHWLLAIRLYALNDRDERELSTISATGLVQRHHLFCGSNRLDVGKDKSVEPDGCLVSGYQRNGGLRSGHPRGRKGVNRHSPPQLRPQAARHPLFSAWASPAYVLFYLHIYPHEATVIHHGPDVKCPTNTTRIEHWQRSRPREVDESITEYLIYARSCWALKRLAQRSSTLR